MTFKANRVEAPGTDNTQPQMICVSGCGGNRKLVYHLENGAWRITSCWKPGTTKKTKELIVDLSRKLQRDCGSVMERRTLKHMGGTISWDLWWRTDIDLNSYSCTIKSILFPPAWEAAQSRIPLSGPFSWADHQNHCPQPAAQHLH